CTATIVHCFRKLKIEIGHCWVEEIKNFREPVDLNQHRCASKTHVISRDDVYKKYKYVINSLGGWVRDTGPVISNQYKYIEY
ncbi:19855_t:CDS:1, partial [Gigaspora rosea]